MKVIFAKQAEVGQAYTTKKGVLVTAVVKSADGSLTVEYDVFGYGDQRQTIPPLTLLTEVKRGKRK